MCSWLHPTALIFSPDDSDVVVGGSDGEVVWWGIKPLYLTSSSYRQAPSHLRVAHLWHAPDGTRLVVDQFYESDDMIGPALRERSILFGKTHNWLSFGLVEHNLIGWSSDSRRLLGTCEGFDESTLWLEQLNAWTGERIARTPINAKEIDLRTICLTDKRSQVSWCAQPYGHAFLHDRLVIDTIRL